MNQHSNLIPENKSRPRVDLIGKINSRPRVDLIGVPKSDRGSVTADELALWLGISPRMVADYSGRDIVVKVDRGRYNLRESVLAYVKHLKGRATSESLTKERTRQAKESADQVAIKNAKSRGELVSGDDVARAWAGVLADIRGAILAVPQRVAGRAGLDRATVEILSVEIRETLEVLADGKT